MREIAVGKVFSNQGLESPKEEWEFYMKRKNRYYFRNEYKAS